MKKKISIYISVIVAGILFSIMINSSFLTWKGQVDEAKNRFPYDAVTFEPIIESDINKIESHANIKEISFLKPLDAGKYKGELISLETSRDKFLKRDELTDGRYPENGKELIISKEFRDKYSSNIGDIVEFELGKRTINGKVIQAGDYPSDGEIFKQKGSKRFKIVGVFENSKKIRIANPNVKTFLEDSDIKPEKFYYVLIDLKTRRNAYETFRQIGKNLGIQPDSFNNYVNANEKLLSLYGASRDGLSGLSATFIVTLAIIFGGVIVFAFMLKNIYKIWAMDKIRELAMYKSIGSTEKQIRRMLIKEGVKYSIPAVIFSLIFGNIMSKLTIDSIKNFAIDKDLMINGAYTFSKYEFNIYVNIFVLVIIIITIAFSVRIPAKELAKINIIEALKGNITNDKKYKKKIMHNTESELRVNNSKLYKSSSNLITIGYLIIFAFFVFLASFEINRDFSSYPLPYDGNINYMTTNYTVPKSFAQIENLEGVKDSFSYAVRHCYMFADEYLSDDFKKSGFYKKAEGRFYYDTERGTKIHLDLIGISNEDYKKLSGSEDYIGAIVLNRVRENFPTRVVDSNYISYMKPVDNIEFYLNYDLDRKIDLDIAKYISTTGFSLYDENLVGYELRIFIPIDLLSKIMNENYSEEEKAENSSLYYNLNIETDNIKGVKNLSEKILESNIRTKERFRWTDTEYIKNGRKANKAIISGLAYIVGLIIMFILIANAYGSLNLFLESRRREFAMLKSLGMDQEQFKHQLQKDFIYYIKIPLIKFLFYSILLAFIYTRFSLLITFKKLFMFLDYKDLLLFILVINIFIFIMFRNASKRYEKINIIEELKSLD